MIQQVLDDQGMSLLSPPMSLMWQEQVRLGSSVLRKGQHMDSLLPPSAAPWEGWREENPLTGLAISLLLFVKCV